MLIQDVERRTGLDRATIRFYEKENLVVPIREDNGYRTYQEHDVELLLKIKLLRQLGVSLFKIKSLQQGSEDFSVILAEQIEMLENRIQDDTRARLVCIEMQKDGAQYADLNVHHYLQILSSAPQSISRTFSEPLERESHPWRRYFARYLDYRVIGAIFNIFIIVILRIRPFDSDAITILSYVANFAAVPILSILLHYWGTTPGKWAMGIRLESIHGGKLSGGEALYREGKILWHGLGFFVPILEVWREYRSYQQEKNGIAQSWNEDTEIIYETWSVRRKCMAALIFIVSFSLSVFAGCDTMMPTYRGNGVTLSEFAENFNDYASVPYAQNSIILGDDGKWDKIIEEYPDEKRPEFIYKLDDYGNIREILYENSFKSSHPIYILPEYCKTAIMTSVGSAKGSQYKDIVSVDKVLENQWYSKLPQNGGASEGYIQFEDVTIAWESNIENCKYIAYGSLFAADDSMLLYDLKLTVKFTS